MFDFVPTSVTRCWKKKLPQKVATAAFNVNSPKSRQMFWLLLLPKPLKNSQFLSHWFVAKTFQKYSIMITLVCQEKLATQNYFLTSFRNEKTFAKHIFYLFRLIHSVLKVGIFNSASLCLYVFH